MRDPIIHQQLSLYEDNRWGFEGSPVLSMDPSACCERMQLPANAPPCGQVLSLSSESPVQPHHRLSSRGLSYCVGLEEARSDRPPTKTHQAPKAGEAYESNSETSARVRTERSYTDPILERQRFNLRRPRSDTRAGAEHYRATV